MKKGALLVLNRIPFVDMIIDLKESIQKGKKMEASVKLFDKMNGFISVSIFGKNNSNWIWWMLVLNIIISILLIKLQIG